MTHILKNACILLQLGLLLGCSSSEPDVTNDPSVNVNLSAESQKFENFEYETLRTDTEALGLGGQLFAANCASCHGVDGSGTRGVPDLTDQVTMFPNTLDSIYQTITAGRDNMMPAMGAELGEVDLGQVVAYVLAFSDAESLGTANEVGAALYEQHCTVCHGPDGKGIPELGAPDLTDPHWQYGSSMMQVRLNITRGIESTCPPHGELLSTAQARILTAYVFNMGNP